VLIEVDGRAVTDGQLRAMAPGMYGHFTAMQVRGGRVRGLDLHLSRLAQANLELFGAALDGGSVRDLVRHALAGALADAADVVDASVRVHAVQPGAAEPTDPVSIMVTVRAGVDAAQTPQSLQSVPHQRPVPHIKQVGGGFGQVYHGRAAERNGFDDALLTGPGGVVAESSIANIAFFDGEGLVWPDAPMLRGITMQVLEPLLADHGVPSRREQVRLADLSSFAGAMLTNARGLSPVGRIDEVRWPAGQDLFKAVQQVYESVPWDVI
jgi:branched-subunit amino acid aminotransferase/4-amino-4-deoxychorismate lyase